MIKTLALNGKALLTNSKELGWGQSITLPPYTIRLLYRDGITPDFTRPLNRGATITQVSAEPNIWDVTLESSDWTALFMVIRSATENDLLEVLGANTTNVTNMQSLFRENKALTRIASLDTTNVTNMQQICNFCTSLKSLPQLKSQNVTNALAAFSSCSALTFTPIIDFPNATNVSSLYAVCTSIVEVPLLNIPKATRVDYLFSHCYNVKSGTLALYRKLALQEGITNHTHAFWNCGSDTIEGAAELAQIPDDWK
jgi:surface protein